MIKQVVPSLESERLKLIKLDVRFLSINYVNWLNDLEVVKYLEINKKYTLNSLKEYLIAIDDNIYFWAVIIKQNNKHIGNIKIDPLDKINGTAELGLMIGDRSEWHKGFASETINTIIKFCFFNLGLRKITLGVVKDNVNAVKLYEKLGFKVEDEFVNYGYYDNKLSNVLRMAIFNAIE
jgi:ribosomal-protein-alanine N-acetyltransferase